MNGKWLEEKSPLVSIQRIFIGEESFTQVSFLIMEQKSLYMFKVSPTEIVSSNTPSFNIWLRNNERAGQFNTVTIWDKRVGHNFIELCLSSQVHVHVNYFETWINQWMVLYPC